MEQFKVLILVNLAIIILSSCDLLTNEKAKAKMSNNKDLENSIEILMSQYETIDHSNGIFDIKLIDNELIRDIENSSLPIFSIEIEKDRYYIVKGNSIVSSSVPDSCDYFYSITLENEVFLKEDTFYLRKADYR